MQTAISKKYKKITGIDEAEAILRSCVHCGFCMATCPSYQILQNELDGPRGRIYLIKEMLEGHKATTHTQLHLDRCLTCRSCETTCPSGVKYSRLLDIGRMLVEKNVGRGLVEKLYRWFLLTVIPNRSLLRKALVLGRAFHFVLPESLKSKIGKKPEVQTRPESVHSRKMILFEGCVQAETNPEINAATARVFDRAGITLLTSPEEGCCGAMHQHMSKQARALKLMRANIDAWWPMIESGVEAIVISASGCGVTIKEYGELLKHDKDYADKAQRISNMTRDISEVLSGMELSGFNSIGQGKKIAFQSPCTLQHGQMITGKVEAILESCGYQMTKVPDSHLCCGSAGTYSILQPKIANELRDNKLKALAVGKPDIIATANIGCHSHLTPAAEIPVKHWIELLDTQ